MHIQNFTNAGPARVQVAKTALHGWIHVHTKTVIRANKLINLMWKWDRNLTLRSWSSWLGWMHHRALVSSSA